MNIEKIRIGIIEGCLQIIKADNVSLDAKLKAVIILNDMYAQMINESLKRGDIYE